MIPLMDPQVATGNKNSAISYLRRVPYPIVFLVHARAAMRSGPWQAERGEASIRETLPPSRQPSHLNHPVESRSLPFDRSPTCSSSHASHSVRFSHLAPP
mmetsp:Transcript_16866/g.38422  ORF Transcript_16866/g.38422 Transcript_16866/m.38422 type:complete len:100 (-) Transcript_16866:13-312(-)